MFDEEIVELLKDIEADYPEIADNLRFYIVDLNKYNILLREKQEINEKLIEYYKVQALKYQNKYKLLKL